MFWRPAALGCLLASGCLLTTNLDGFTSDAAIDGGPDSNPATADAAVDGDAALGDAGDATPTACAHSFCADFDESTDINQAWQKPELSGAGAVALETTIVRSKPHAFAASVPAMSGFDAALLTKYFSRVATEAHLDFYVFFDHLDVSVNQLSLGVVTQETSTGDDYSRLRIIVRNGQADLTEEYTNTAGPQSHETLNPYAWPLGTWVHVHLDTDTTSATLSVDGAKVATIAKLGSWKEPIQALKLGVYYSKGQTGQRIVFDDIWLDSK